MTDSVKDSLSSLARTNTHVCGYTRVGIEKGDGSFDAGFSVYSAVWPLLGTYPGHAFQSGLFGTWMFADSENPNLEDVWFYSTIEGGLGWWRDTEYPTETPKFIMGAVAVGFCGWANGPGAGKGRDWSDPKGHYGIAQLSPNLLWPPDGLNLKQGTCGELLGYGYTPLPLTAAKATTAGAAVPTGDQSWTLFLNAANFKGPATFVLPYFFSGPTVKDPRLAGKFLDRVPARQDRHLAMETQYLPWVEAPDSRGRLFARLAPTFLPGGDGDGAVVLHQVTAYSRRALWDRVDAWFKGGEAADSRIGVAGAHRHAFNTELGVGWEIWEPGLGRGQRAPIGADAFIRPVVLDPHSMGYAAQSDRVTRAAGPDGSLMMLPEFYQQVDAADAPTGKRWVAVAPDTVPQETGLQRVQFERADEPEPSIYVTPEDEASCWKSPGPVAGPFTARPGDGSEVTYYWYRFADQPALLNADLSDAERETLQQRVEQIHQQWTPDREYLAPPAVGSLASIDPALLVEPPKGLEVGYVPIVTRQGPAV